MRWMVFPHRYSSHAVTKPGESLQANMGHCPNIYNTSPNICKIQYLKPGTQYLIFLIEEFSREYSCSNETGS